MKYSATDIQKAINIIKEKIIKIKQEKEAKVNHTNKVIAVLKTSWQSNPIIISTEDQLKYQKNCVLKWIKEDTDRLYTHYDLSNNLLKCQSLGCGSCSLERCLIARDIIQCICSHCPFKIEK